jgi:histidine triad (HIT) family protein
VTTDPKFVDGCEFCAIAQGKDRTVDIICEGTTWLAFFPLDPATPGHTLVIPRAHVEDLWKLPPALGSELMLAIIKVGHAIDLALAPEGMNLITSAGSAAEQTVFHLHLHLVPRWRRDGFGRIWPVEGKYEDDQLDQVAERIREACSGL